MENQKILNPITKRYVKINSQQYNKLVLEGLIKPPVEEIKNEIKVAEPPIKALLAETLTDVVKENKKQFEKEMSQKDCDKLLKKLLYEKLCLTKKPKKDKPEKKKKKIKFKVKTPEPSESESQSESDDSS